MGGSKGKTKVGRRGREKERREKKKYRRSGRDGGQEEKGGEEREAKLFTKGKIRGLGENKDDADGNSG